MSKKRAVIMGELFFVGRVLLFTISHLVPEKNIMPAGFPISPDTLGPSMCYLYTCSRLGMELRSIFMVVSLTIED